MKVEALSHTTEFRANQSLLRDIGAAMEEAVWQGATLTFPLPEGAQPRVDRAHADLAQRHGSAWISTVPLVKSGRPCGAITLERNRAEALSRADLTLCENIGALLGPLLEVKRTVDKPWPAKIAAALREAHGTAVRAWPPRGSRRASPWRWRCWRLPHSSPATTA